MHLVVFEKKEQSKTSGARKVGRAIPETGIHSRFQSDWIGGEEEKAGEYEEEKEEKEETKRR